jgi:hypothetical protein
LYFLRSVSQQSHYVLHVAKANHPNGSFSGSDRSFDILGMHYAMPSRVNYRVVPKFGLSPAHHLIWYVPDKRRLSSVIDLALRISQRPLDFLKRSISRDKVHHSNYKLHHTQSPTASSIIIMSDHTDIIRPFLFSVRLLLWLSAVITLALTAWVVDHLKGYRAIFGLVIVSIRTSFDIL